MARKNWSEAPVKVRARVEEWIAAGDLFTAAQVAFAEGYAFSVADVENLSRVHKQIEELKAAGDTAAADRFRHDNRPAFDAEARALELAKARHHWATKTSESDDAEVRRAAVLAQQEEQRARWVQERARELKSEAERRAWSAFVVEAEREWNRAHGGKA